MRILAAILSFYLLGIIFCPCADAQEAHRDYGNDIHPHGDCPESEHQDFCSPFCCCQCCHVSMLWTLTSIPIKQAEKHIPTMVDSPNFLSHFQRSIWEPPRV